MFKEWIKDIDVAYMLRKGTLAWVITFAMGVLFGRRDMMIAFVLVLGANQLEKQNLRVKTIYKLVKLILIDSLIVGVAFIAAQNLVLGIFINLITLFIIIYHFVSPYNQANYKTYMMLYVFTQYNAIAFKDLPNRLGLVSLTLTAIVAATYCSQRNRGLNRNIKLSIERLIQHLEYIERGEFEENMSHACSVEINHIAYSVYMTGFKKYLTTYLGKIEFDFYIHLSYLNLLIGKLDRAYVQHEFSKYDLALLKEVLTQILCSLKTQKQVLNLKELLKPYKEEKETLHKEIYHCLMGVAQSIEEWLALEPKKSNKPYKEWKRLGLDRFWVCFRAYLKPKSIGFNFAVRMAVILTIALALSAKLGYYKLIWAIIPIMSIMQPYYEDTILRTKARVQSNVIAALSVGLILNWVDFKFAIVVVLLIAFYLVYAFKDYYRMSLALCMLSMCMSALTDSINTLVFYRVTYVLIGSLIVIVGGKMRAYHLNDGVKELIHELDELNNGLEQESIKSIQGKQDPHAIRDMMLHSMLLCDQLYIKNQRYKSKQVAELIKLNNEFVVKACYETL